MVKDNKTRDENKYDVCLSFAGEDRTYVHKVADELQARGIRVFYDEYEQIDLWGKDLYSYLDDIYRNTARYCVIFISKHYASKLWTNHERKSAQARAFSENKEYILPARFDDTDISGILPTIGCINLENIEPTVFAGMIAEKIGKSECDKFLPPKLDLLYKELDKLCDEWGIKKKDKEIVKMQAKCFFEVLERLSNEELLVLMNVLLRGCPVELPKNTHVSIDLIRRYTGFPISKIKRILGRLKSLGVFCILREQKHGVCQYIGKSPEIALEYHVMSTSEYGGNATDVAYVMIYCAVSGYCEEHGMEKLLSLDFSQLSSSTRKKHKH